MKRLLVALALAGSTALPTPSHAAGPASGEPANVVLEIGGASTGFVKSVSRLGYTRLADGKVVAQSTPMPVDFEIGFGNKLQLAWMAAFANGTGSSTKLELGFADTNFDLQHLIELHDFSITELTIPACNGGSSALGFLGVGGKPAKIAKIPASGELTSPTGESPAGKSKVWRLNDFSVTIAGLDTSKIAKLGPIHVKKGQHG